MEIDSRKTSQSTRDGQQSEHGGVSLSSSQIGERNVGTQLNEGSIIDRKYIKINLLPDGESHLLIYAKVGDPVAADVMITKEDLIRGLVKIPTIKRKLASIEPEPAAHADALQHLFEEGTWTLELSGHFGGIISLDDWTDLIEPGGVYCIRTSQASDRSQTSSSLRSNSILPENYETFATGSKSLDRVDQWTKNLPPPRTRQTAPTVYSQDSGFASLDSSVSGSQKQFPSETFRPSSHLSSLLDERGHEIPYQIYPSSSTSGTKPTANSSVIITAYTYLPALPCLYPPDEQYVFKKCSFSPTTQYWKALKVLTGSNNTSHHLVRLEVKRDRDGKRRVYLGKRLTNSRDSSLEQMGFTVDDRHGKAEYLVKII